MTLNQNSIKSKEIVKRITEKIKSPTRKLTGIPLFFESKLLVPVLAKSKKSPSIENFSYF